MVLEALNNDACLKYVLFTKATLKLSHCDGQERSRRNEDKKLKL